MTSQSLPEGRRSEFFTEWQMADQPDTFIDLSTEPEGQAVLVDVGEVSPPR
jgi:hypothetical protein